VLTVFENDIDAAERRRILLNSDQAINSHEALAAERISPRARGSIDFYLQDSREWQNHSSGCRILEAIHMGFGYLRISVGNKCSYFSRPHNNAALSQSGQRSLNSTQADRQALAKFDFAWHSRPRLEATRSNTLLESLLHASILGCAGFSCLQRDNFLERIQSDLEHTANPNLDAARIPQQSFTSLY
jgi:hypothetical protein